MRSPQLKRAVFPLVAVLTALLLGRAACQMNSVDDPDFDDMASNSGSGELDLPVCPGNYSSMVMLVDGCELPDEVPDKPCPPASEQEAEIQALCHVHCLQSQRFISDISGDDRDELFPGGRYADFIPSSHLFRNADDSIECGRGYDGYQICRLGCEAGRRMRDDCVQHCNTECGNLSNEPCTITLICVFEGQRRCRAGCNTANSISMADPYPDGVVPAAPVLNRVVDNSYTLDIEGSLTNFPRFLDLETSAVIVRITDTSPLEEEISYIILYDGLTMDLSPFICRSIEVSIALVSHLANEMSPFSPATSMDVVPEVSQVFPGQLDSFRHSFEEDQRLEFFDHHVIHLEWDEPERAEAIQNYTIKLEIIPTTDECVTSKTITGVSANATSFSVRADTRGDAPVSECRYRVTIIANPFVLSVDTLFSEALTVPEYQHLSDDTVDFTCSVQLNRNTTLYDVTFTWNIPFPDPVLFSIDSLDVALFVRPPSEVDMFISFQQDFAKVVVPNTANISQTYEAFVPDLRPLTVPGQFYRFRAMIDFEIERIRTPTTVQHTCNERDVGPVPPDPVDAASIMLSSDFFQLDINDRRTVVGLLSYSWEPPVFKGFGDFNGYDVYVGRDALARDAPIGTATNTHGPDAADGSFAYIEPTEDQNFIINFQIRPRTMFADGLWSEPIPFNASTFTIPKPDVMTEQDFNATITNIRASDDGMSAITTLSVEWTPQGSVYGNITEVEVAVGATELGPTDEPPAGQSMSFPVQQGTASFVAALPIPTRLSDSFVPFPIFVQMRAITEFNVSGTWNTSQVLRLEDVLPPENITVQVVERNIGVVVNETVTLSVSVALNWLPPSEFSEDQIQDYAAFLAQDFIEEPFGSLPPLASFAAFDSDSISGTLAGSFDVGNTDNFTLYVQMRTVATSGSTGEWSEPIPVRVTRPVVSQLPLVLGTSITFGLLFLLLVILVVACCLFFIINSLRIKYGYKTVQSKHTGLEDFTGTYIPAGYFEGKELLLDDWEVEANDCIVEDKLGEGAFGEVYKGVMRGPLRNPKISAVLKNTIGLPVAVKLLKTTASNKEKAEFLSEIELMKKIAEGYNAHIVNMIGCITLQEPLCLITEFVPHGDLISYLKAMRKKATTDRRRQKFLQQHYEAYQEMKRLAEEQRRQLEQQRKQSKQQEDIERGYTFLPAITRPSESENEPDVESTEIKEALEGHTRTPPDNQAAYAMDDLQASPLDNKQIDGAYDSASIGEVEPEKPAPYIEAVNEYSHLDPLSPVDLQKFAPELPPDLLDEADFDEYTEVGKLEAGDLMQFAYQIATGMDYLASLSIVHRDLACRNILVGDGKKLKITDFGLSREVEEVYVKQTKGRLPLKWMALESIEERVFTTSSDVWSYGVTLWEIATVGGFPYPTIPNTDLLMMLKQGYRLEKPENCAPQVYDIMLECWQEHAEDRPTFSQLRSKFDALISETTDDPYMQLEVDEMKPYYSTEAEEEGKQFANTERVNAKGGEEFKKGRKQMSLISKPSNPYVESPVVSSSMPTTSFMPGADPVRSQPELVPHAEEESEDRHDDDQSSGDNDEEQSAYADQPAMRPIPQPGFTDDIHEQSPQVGIPLSMLNQHKPVTQGSTKSTNPYVDEPGKRMPSGNDIAINLGNGNQPVPDQITVL